MTYDPFHQLGCTCLPLESVVAAHIAGAPPEPTCEIHQAAEIADLRMAREQAVVDTELAAIQARHDLLRAPVQPSSIALNDGPGLAALIGAALVEPNHPTV